MNKEKVKAFFKNKFVLFFLGLLLVIVLWEIIAFSTGLLFLPEFFSCVGKAFSLLGEARTYEAIGYTLLRFFLALLGSTILGVFLGTLAGYYEPMAKIMMPLITFLRAFPTVALILLLIVYVPMVSVWVVGFVLFPVIYQAAMEGASKAFSDFEMIIRLKGKSHLSNITKVILPLSMDYILLGVIQSVGLGMKVEIMSETFSMSSKATGLGQMIMASYQNVDYTRLMALVLISLLLVLILDLAMKGTKEVIEIKIGISKEHDSKSK